MQNLNIAIEYIKSEEYLSWVVSNLKWCEHGSNLIDYFDYEGLEEEYANSNERKIIVKRYIQSRIREILKEFKEEQQELLYRTIYSNSTPNEYDFYGHFWSSREDTNPCVEQDFNEEYLLTCAFDSEIIDWVETLKSRMDFLYGKKEKEYYLKKCKIKLINIEKIN